MDPRNHGRPGPRAVPGTPGAVPGTPGTARRTGPVTGLRGGRPGVDQELLDRACALVKDQGLTPTEASEQLEGEGRGKISKSRIYDELRRRASAAVADAAGEPPEEQLEPADELGRSPAAAPPAPPTEERDELSVYDDLLKATKLRLDVAEPARYGALVKVYRELLADRRKLAPPKPKTDEEAEAEAQAAADEVVRKLLQAVTDAEARAGANGVCFHCGAPLEPAADADADADQ